MPDQSGHLQVSMLSLRFGGLRVLDDVSFNVAPGEVVGLIGPNGAGKTALLNCIGGLYRPAAGSVRFCGKSLTDSTALAAKHGIGRTFQHSYLSPAMSVIDNVMLGLTPRYTGGMLRRFARPWLSSREERHMRALAYAALERCGAAEFVESKTDALPFSIRKRVDLARALVNSPKLLLLDEPAAGLSNSERSLIPELIRIVRAKKDISVMWIEHDLDLVISVSTRIIVMRDGRIIADRDPCRSESERKYLVDCYLNGIGPDG